MTYHSKSIKNLILFPSEQIVCEHIGHDKEGYYIREDSNLYSGWTGNFLGRTTRNMIFPFPPIMLDASVTSRQFKVKSNGYDFEETGDGLKIAKGEDIKFISIKEFKHEQVIKAKLLWPKWKFYLFIFKNYLDRKYGISSIFGQRN